VEKAQELAQQDAARSYVYSIDGRGRKTTDILGLTPMLSQFGLPMSTFKLVSVPLAGAVKTTSLSIKDPSRESFWMPRRVFMDILATGLEGFQVLTGSEVKQIERIDRDEASILRVQVVSGDVSRTFEPQLIVGADGVRSIVRRTLAESEPEGSSRFQMIAFDSPGEFLSPLTASSPPLTLLC
jgi:kynurenine 3-monooxygenase